MAQTITLGTQFGEVAQLSLIQDSQVAMHIASNLVFMKGRSILKLMVTLSKR